MKSSLATNNAVYSNDSISQIGKSANFKQLNSLKQMLNTEKVKRLEMERQLVELIKVSQKVERHIEEKGINRSTPKTIN